MCPACLLANTEATGNLVLDIAIWNAAKMEWTQTSADKLVKN